MADLAYDIAASDAVALDRERLAERVERMLYRDDQGDDLERAHRRGWNAAIKEIAREIRR